jgi:outer membrane lipoprotein-sorting protein
MRRLRTTPLHQIGLAAALVVALVIGGVGIAQAVSNGGTPPPKPLDRAIYDAARAPEPQGITARIHFSNNLLPSGSLPQGGPGASPVITGADGRLWLTNDGRLRLELQSDSGDAQIVSDGKRFSVYDATSNTVYTGPLPQDQHQKAAKQPEPALGAIRRSLADLGRMWNLTGATPTNTAGQPSYTVRISPKDDGGLLGAGEIAWDAANGTPLRAAVYAQGQKSPVLELEATEIKYGPVKASDVAVKPPAGAKKVQVSPPVARDSHGNQTSVHGLAAVQRRVDFPISAPATLAGLPRREVSLVQSGSKNGAVVTYGQGLGAILVFQEKSSGQGAPMGRGDLRLPEINIDGVTGSEIATSLGTIVTFDRNGVSYTVAGSVPPLAAENAARGLR